MDRREFFKSSALWLAGLLVVPHLKLMQPEIVSITGFLLAEGDHSSIWFMSKDEKVCIEYNGRLLESNEWHHLTITKSLTAPDEIRIDGELA